MITRARGDILHRMTALADGTRGRLLLALERQELTVSELCAVLQLPQSTVSRHLRVLADDGWVGSRPEGASRRYRMEATQLDQPARRLWNLVREQLSATPAAAQDAERVRSILARRRTRSQEFFASSAGQWDRLRSELFGQRFETFALLGLLDPDWTVGDLGCGTGLVSAALALFVRSVVAVDASAAMLSAARKRLVGQRNVELRSGDLESLPIDDEALDAAVLFLVLHYVGEPQPVLAEVHRVLKPHGRLLVVDMMPHEREHYRQEMGHVWLGFDEDQLGGWASSEGFSGYRYQPLPADPDAKGPTLFAASARRS
jgi:ubiquinone/menaquinone biosynthesis C-methylase UbiE